VLLLLPTRLALQSATTRAPRAGANRRTVPIMVMNFMLFLQGAYSYVPIRQILLQSGQPGSHNILHDVKERTKER